MLKYRLTTALAALLMTLPVGFAQAGDWSGHHGRHAHHANRNAVIGSNGLPSVIPGIGTFSGSVSGLRIKGNGVFLAIDRGLRPQVIAYRAPKAKIIEITAENPDEACSFEAGVCVIRPKN
ncbi:hypothetical protein QWE_02300 [Agrobacterium albertimagni AOL15]|uniref:Uncharacterized protein n=1 Tax=Agrobacterium albertimagni AOL15 TaxID=1156935 RepID=K2PK98_9HYPH|nr:hypothetical protein [Agrobacterium albertimagni]EKF61363.1 hypothetical protein QWE_02300 [Agrobacterium albertimagni AOL15]